ncbi:acetyl-coenzyme A transporter 1-like isoform X1 [Macrosteles quadrilineatus]|uniref:acetyl-coenzyme A transporter 1-like isoform X1 n=2 Tax=Macrosteles quadrilineatus TaxID=74068 RepID=UPI0023E0A873|nr:acetyl-coenzyme A transporter 1-like isoform X1 [Macrosteles quadrilineatus]
MENGNKSTEPSLMESTRRRMPEEMFQPLIERDSEEERVTVRPGANPLHGDRGNIALLLFLYTLQGVPLGLAAAMPMLLQNKGVDYKNQAMFSLVTWPFSIKLLWAPIVDALFSERFGRRKTWLIPVQYLLGLFMLLLSYHVNYWITDPNGPHIVLLTIMFFILNFLGATQDIAVDGWAITMLKKQNVGYASTANSVGQTAGYFIGYVVFTALESATFCNSYLRTVPQFEGIVTLPSFLYGCGWVFLLTTTLVGVMKTELPPRPEDEPSLDILGTYKQLLRIIRLPAVRNLALIFLTVKVGFSACDSVTTLKLIEGGVPRAKFAMIAVFLVPLQIGLPLLLSKYIVGQTPLDMYSRVFPYRLIFNLVAAAFVWVTPRLITEGDVPNSYTVILVILFGFHQVTMYTMFVSQMAFFARISDPAYGGTYMTLLNTLSNLGTTWPNSLILLFVDTFTFKYCSNNPTNTCLRTDLIEACTKDEGFCLTWIDGYYILTLLCTLYGLLWRRWGCKATRQLQRRDLNDWKVSQRDR